MHLLFITGTNPPLEGGMESFGGGFLIARFLFHYFAGDSGIGRYVQSVSIGGTLSIFGIFLVFLGLLGNAVRANRAVMEEILIRLREQSGAASGTPSEINGSPILRAEKHLDGHET